MLIIVHLKSINLVLPDHKANTFLILPWLLWSVTSQKMLYFNGFDHLNILKIKIHLLINWLARYSKKKRVDTNLLVRCDVIQIYSIWVSIKTDAFLYKFNTILKGSRLFSTSSYIKNVKVFSDWGFSSLLYLVIYLSKFWRKLSRKNNSKY